MLELGKDWRFPIDEELSKVWLTPKGVWGLSIRCKSTEVKVEGALEESFAPRLVIDDLGFIGSHWQDLVGIEIDQEGLWHGDGDPSASLVVEQRGDLRETAIRVVGTKGTSFEIQIEAECDVFIDDDHDKDVPLKVNAFIPFEGIRFRFRADGLDSRDPARKAVDLLSKHFSPDGFEDPEVESLTEPGLYRVFFAPKASGEPNESGEPISGEVPIERELSAEERVLHQSARELLQGMVGQKWIELEEGGVDALVPGLVDILEIPGRGSSRAERVSDWFMDQDEVVEVHVNDEDLAKVLDKYW